MKKLFTVFGSLPTQEAKVQKSRMIYVVMAIVMMILAPSYMKGQTTIDFGNAALGAHFRDAGQSGYYADFVMGDDFSAIGSGARKGVRIDYKYGNTGSVDISRLAFAINSNGKGNARNEGAGFYLRREKIRVNGTDISLSGLFTGSWDNKIAVLDLKPGDKVTFYASASNEPNTTNNLGIKYCKDYDANVWAHVNGGSNMKFVDGDSWPNTNTIYIDSPGDLVVQPNKDVYITSIVIENGPRAEYDITTSGNTTTFQFTQDGSLNVNDYTVPYMQASFGNANDYLMVSGLKAEMHRIPSWSETLVAEGHNNQPSAGSFYEFKPTAGGKITVEGSLTGRVHLFVYDPTPGTDTWVQKQGNYPIFYKLNFPDPNHLNPGQDSPYYDANYSFTNLNNGNVSFSFSVEKNKYYYICIDKGNDEEVNGNYAFHLQKFSFTPTFHIPQYAKIVDLDEVQGDIISLVQVQGAGSAHVNVKRCSGNFTDMYLASLTHLQLNQYGWLNIPKPEFKEGTDNAGTIIFTIDSPNGDATFVVTFPYHASYDVTGDAKDPYRTYGHTWNFIDPRISDSNIGNCREYDGYSEFKPAGTAQGFLSIGQKKNTNSQFYYELMNREWTYSQRQTGQAGGFHDPYYANVWDMEGDNADMIWETEGLWFDTGTNLSCIYNEKNPLVWDTNKTPNEQIGNPLNFTSPQLTDDNGQPVTKTNNDGETVPAYEDPDRYVGLLPDEDGKSSFTIPGLKDGDRVLIFMKSGEATATNGIFLNVYGAKDALGNPITSSDLYKAGGTNWQHERYEGCYHFIKDGNGSMKFDMVEGSMCKLMYIRIYTGQRINTNNIVSTNSAESDNSKLLFINDKDATTGSNASMSLRFRGKGQDQTNTVLTYSGNLKANSFTGDNFKVSGTYNQTLVFTSKVGEIGMFRLRQADMEYNNVYAADFCDRNFTVGYRDKVDSYPYTWDLTDIKGFSSTALSNEASNYVSSKVANNDEYGDQWDISLFDTNGYMKLNTGFDPEGNNHIFDAHRIGYGNQLWADTGVIPETRGLWFYTDDNYALYNDCMQITSEGISFCNTAAVTGHEPWWNYKMVVPDVPNNAAVYLRMKRDSRVEESMKQWSDKDGANVLFLNTRFHFGTSSSSNPKTSLTEDTQDIYITQENGTGYSFYKVPGTDDEYILAVRNTTGAADHLTFTLNGWIVKKVAVSTDEKKVNVKGWTTESRDHVIDPELTTYMTGVDFETCLVTGVDYEAETVTLQRVNTSKKVMRNLSDGANGANIIHNKANEEAKILNGGFHLFVPDMHDYTQGGTNNQKSVTNGNTDGTNMLIAQVSNSNGAKVIPATSTINGKNYTNYALTYQYYKLDADGNKYGSKINGDEAFYRIATGGASSSGNQGYLPLLTAYVDPSSSSYGTNPSSENNNGAKFSIIFVDEPELDNYGIATQINEVESTGRVTTSEGFYNLNGQKMNGVPTKKGLYIVNGKKVLVK